jgi:hypothetical protein
MSVVRMAEDGMNVTLPLPIACSRPCKKPFSTLHHYRLYLAYRGEWTHMAFELPAVWASDQKTPVSNFFIIQ